MIAVWVVFNLFTFQYMVVPGGIKSLTLAVLIPVLPVGPVHSSTPVPTHSWEGHQSLDDHAGGGAQLVGLLNQHIQSNLQRKYPIG